MEGPGALAFALLSRQVELGDRCSPMADRSRFCSCLRKQHVLTAALQFSVVTLAIQPRTSPCSMVPTVTSAPISATAVSRPSTTTALPPTFIDSFAPA